MTAYTQALTILSPLLAGLFWAAAFLLARQGRLTGQRKRRLGSILWAVHSAIYWTVNAVLRLGFDYAGPTLLFSAWATVLSMHAAFSLLTMAVLLMHYESSPDSSV